MNVKWIIPVLGLVALLSSCAEHNVPLTFDCSSEEVSYQNDVKVIVSNNCALSGCHNGDNGADKNWTEFDKIKSKAEQVRIRITLPPGAAGHMPAKGSLTYDEIRTLVCWVEQGAPDN